MKSRRELFKKGAKKLIKWGSKAIAGYKTLKSKRTGGKTVWKNRRGGKTRHTKKKKYKSKSIFHSHNDLSVEFLGTFVVGKQKHIKCSAKFRYLEGKEGILSGNAGIQNVASLPQMLTYNQMSGNSTAASRIASYDKWEVDPFQMNPYIVKASSAIYPAIAATNDADKLAVLGCDSKLYLVSLESAAMEIEIYWFLLKVDTDDTMITLIDDCMSAENLGQTGATTDNTIGANTATGGGEFKDRYGYELMENSQLRRVCKVLKRVKCTLQPGDRKTYSINFKFNKVVTKNYMNERNKSFWANHTVLPVAVVRGALTGINTTGLVTTPAGEVTFASTKLGFVTENHWEFGALPVQRWNTQRVYPPYIVNPAAGALIQVDVKDTIALLANA